MAYRAGYWVDLSGVKLDESSTSLWIQAMPLGTYEHPEHGEIVIDPERVQRFAANVKSNVRGTDLDIDYDHKERSGEAAGWVRDAEARTDGLWLLVEWTKKAFDLIRDKAYRYFSPEFADEWTHPKTQTKHSDVLFGGGLTNRPFLKDILPINMSELTKRGKGMDPKELRKLLNLPEDAPDDRVKETITRLSADSEKKVVNAGEGQTEEVVRLAESNPAVKALLDRVKTQETKLAEVSAALRLSEVQTTVKHLTEDSKYIYPAPVVTTLSEVLLDVPRAVASKIEGMFTKLSEAGLKPRGEIGSTRTTNEDGAENTATKRFSDRVTKYMAEHTGVNYADATEAVFAADPLLFAEYREESLAFHEK